MASLLVNASGMLHQLRHLRRLRSPYPCAFGGYQVSLSALSSSSSSSSSSSQSSSSSSSESYYDKMQSIMHDEGLDFLIIPTADYHMSEYIPAEFKLIEKLCNFTGSSSTLLLSSKSSNLQQGQDRSNNIRGHLFVDGRYHVQAENEVDTNAFSIVKLDMRNSPSLPSFIDKLQSSSRSKTSSNRSIPTGKEVVVGIDPFLHNISAVNMLQNYYSSSLSTASTNKTKNVRNFELKCLNKSIISSKLNSISDSIYIHERKYAGTSLDEKVASVREELKFLSSISSEKIPISGVLVSALDEIAWLLNLRGKDVECNPIFLSYVVVSMTEVHFFVDESKLSKEAVDYLCHHNVTIHEYDVNLIAQVIKKSFIGVDKNRIVMDRKSTSYGLFKMIESITNVIHNNNTSTDSKSNSDSGEGGRGTYLIDNSIISLLKSVKNDKEIAGMKSAHIRDGAAIVEFMAQLDKRFRDNKKYRISEIEIDNLLQDKRKEVSKCMYINDSFSTISAVGKNAAIVHYRANEQNPSPFYLEMLDANSSPNHSIGNNLGARKAKDASQNFKTNCLLLLDSGAQYFDGTTDVTRTILVSDGRFTEGEVSNCMKLNAIKDSYTRVLKGFLAVDQAVLPLVNMDNSYKYDYYHSCSSISVNCGFVLDSLARQFLLKVNKNYLHGTGHGVGAALNVHESPVSLSSNSSSSIVSNKIPILPGMIFSNEPGYYDYKEEYGIRIENLLLAVSGIDGKSIHFERLTHVPIQMDLVDLELLSREERDCLNTYHKTVYDRVTPLLLTNEARIWIKEATKKI